MATFDVYLQKAGDPNSAKVEQIDAAIIGEAWELARAKYYRPLDDPEYTDYQIVRIEAEGETASRAAAIGMPMWANNPQSAQAQLDSVKPGDPVQGEPGYVAPQGLGTLEKQRNRAMATGRVVKDAEAEATTKES